MKHLTATLFTTLLLLITSGTAKGQKSRMNVVSSNYDYVMTVNKAKVEEVNGNVVASLQLTAKQDVPSHQSVILVPELQDTISDRNAIFPVIYINSRNQQIFYEREISRYIKDAIAVRKYNGKDLNISYIQSVPYEKWMETSVLKLRKVSCGCNVPTARGEEWLCSLRERKPQVILTPDYIVPNDTAPKVRHLSGSAFLRFQLDKWDLLLNYFTNASELQKIYNTIDTVKNDKYVTIRRMTIEGYASPEGKLQHNIMLSENRTNALKNYLYQLGLLPHITIEARGMGENWDGFRQYLMTNTLIPQRDKLISILGSTSGLDEKEAQMRKEASEGFHYCIVNGFPRLRCTNYSVEYTVRPLTLEESEEVYETRPINLSLNEIYRLANKYQDNTAKYIAIMQKASLLYPDDPYVNLTMGYLALKRKAADEAETYLMKVPDWPEKLLDMSIVRYMQGKITAEEITKIQNEYKDRVKNKVK